MSAAIAAASLAALAGIGSVPPLTLAGLALFTLCYFALLDRAPAPVSVRWAIAFLFGLVHGFGFAGVLTEAQLPTDRLVRALFGFNVGVELGQLAAVALVWPLLQWIFGARGGRYRPVLVDAGSAAVLAVGLFWFVTRSYG